MDKTFKSAWTSDDDGIWRKSVSVWNDVTDPWASPSTTTETKSCKMQMFQQELYTEKHAFKVELKCNRFTVGIHVPD